MRQVSRLILSLTLSILLIAPPRLGGGAEIPIDYPGVIERSLQQNYGIHIRALAATYRSQDLTEFNARFDTELFGDLFYKRDKLDRTTPLFSDYDEWRFRTGVRKHWITGTDTAIEWKQTNTHEDVLSFFSAFNPYIDARAQVLVRQPLLRNSFGFEDRGEQQILANLIQRDRTEIETSIENSLGQITQAYWGLVLVHETLRIRKEALAQAENLLRIHRRKGRYGLLEDPDLLQTEVNVKERENEVLLAENNLINAQENLAFLLNYSRDDRLIPLDKVELPESHLSEEDEIRIAFENRRDLKQLKEDMKINQVALRVAKFARLPRLDFLATLTANGVDVSQLQAMEDAVTKQGFEYTLGGEVQFPLEGRYAKSQISRALLEKASLVFQTKRTEDQIVEEVGQAVRNVKLRFTLAKRNIEISKLQHQKFQAQTQKFRQGRSTSDLVNRFLEDFLIADLTAASSVVLYRYALIDLLRLQHRLLPPFELDAEGNRALR